MLDENGDSVGGKLPQKVEIDVSIFVDQAVSESNPFMNSRELVFDCVVRISNDAKSLTDTWNWCI